MPCHAAPPCLVRSYIGMIGRSDHLCTRQAQQQEGAAAADRHHSTSTLYGATEAMATSSSSRVSSSRIAGRRAIGSSRTSGGGATATSSAYHSSATLLSPVVIEFGSSCLRIGISGEAAPRHIIPTPAPLASLPRITSLKNEAEWDGCLYPLLSHISTDLLLLKSLKKRPVIVVEPFVSPTAFQDAICRSFLGWLGAPSVTFVPGAATVALPYGLGLGHGIVVDIGRAEGRVTVVAGESGRPLVDTFRVSPCGIEQLAQNFMDIMNGASSKILEKISVSDAMTILHEHFNEKEVIANPATGENISVDRDVVNSCLDETYFDITNPESLLRSFLSSLSSCSIDIRKEVVQNVCFIGGGAEFIPQFERKFLKALADAFSEPATADDSSQAFRSLKPLLDKNDDSLGVIYPLPFSPGVFAWTAASVFGSTGTLPMEQTVQQQAFLSNRREDSARPKSVIRDFLLISAMQE